MNVLIVGRKYTESLAMHIAETLESMGHSVYVFEPGIKQTQHNNLWRLRYIQLRTNFLQLFLKTRWGILQQENKIKSALKYLQFDLVISTHDFLPFSQVRWLKQKFSCKVVMWMPDSIGSLGKLMFLNAEYDALFFKDPLFVDILKREYNINAYYLPECCNPRRHNKVIIDKDDFLKYGCDISTAGNMHTARVRIFKLLKKYKIKIWGNPAPVWMDTTGIEKMIQNHYVTNEEKCKTFRCSKIVLNSLHPSEIESVNVRMFEIAATGSFQISSYRKEIEKLYKIDEEIVVYRTVDELYNKIDYYLNNYELRMSIAERAYERTIKEHTYEKRLIEMFQYLSL